MFHHRYLGAWFAVIATSVMADNSFNTLPGYSLAAAQDRAYCISVGRALRDDLACRNDRAEYCQPLTQVLVNGKVQESIVPIANNEYGYTGVYRSTMPDMGTSTLLYVDKFLGGNQRRLMEAYLVNRNELAKVLSLPPGPITSERRQAEHLEFSENVNAEEFTKLLTDGIKIGDDFMPAVSLAGKQVILHYSCVGETVSEGDPFCPHIGVLHVLELGDGKQPVAYCTFVETKRRREKASLGNRK